MYLFFDTETTGLPKNWNESPRNFDNWPRLVQIAWSNYDEHGNKLAEHNYIIKPKGFEIPKEASDIHKITTERANLMGVELSYALDMFTKTLENTKTLVAHNISFDKAIIGAELIRAGKEEFYDVIKNIDKICTMQSSTKYCNLPGPRGIKWPRLEELHNVLFPGVEIENDLHDALVDVRVMVDCFNELRLRKVI
jgi:DNA polymerase III epsilon subunit-like protein